MKPTFRQNKVHFISLGCARNLVDTEIMLGLVLQAGYEVIDSISHADFFIINTCSFLQASREESLNTIAKISMQKKSRAKIIVTGCMVQSHKDILEKYFPKTHYFVGAGHTDQILQALQSKEEGELISDMRSYIYSGEVPRTLSTPKHYAYLKIAEGCKKRCSFCIIPIIKGKLQSKLEEIIIKEFSALLAQGVFEIILIAQDLGDYGKDQNRSGGLVSLLEKLLLIDKPFWIRLLYLYPDEITDELIALIARDKRICPYIDMPIQHCNNQILKAMHRKTNKEQIVQTIRKLRAAIPHIVIRTSLMVGFPGETEAQFQELVAFVQEQRLDHIGIFTYSKEELSYSSKLPLHIPEKIKNERRDIISKTQQHVLQDTMKKYIGLTLPVIIEGNHPDSPYLMRGRFSGQAPEVDGEIIINDTRLVDELGANYEVFISGTLEYDLVGQVVKKLSKTQEKKQTKFPLTIVA
ncbi:MAG: 30S ribosomal protein S12 methylthiotransferase RimO [Chlamydiales bacterium]